MPESLLDTVETCPMELFDSWFIEAGKEIDRLPEAMALATADSDGKPSVRWVLLKGYDAEGFVFYTDYRSRKGKEIEKNPFVSAGLWWKEMERQVRIEGQAEKVSDELSDDYFKSRPRGSQVAVWASHQSRETTPDDLKARYDEEEEKYANREVPRPEYWGGYRIVPVSVEFWQGRPNRLHERLRFDRVGDGWRRGSLAP